MYWLKKLDPWELILTWKEIKEIRVLFSALILHSARINLYFHNVAGNSGFLRFK